MFRPDQSQQEHKNNAEFLAQQALEIPNGFECPITGEIMTDPVIAADGHTYERGAIEQWINLGKRTSPLTNNTFSHLTLIDNHNLKKAIASWKEQRPIIRTVVKRDEDYELAVKLYIEQQEAAMNKRALSASNAASSSSSSSSSSSASSSSSSAGASGFTPQYQATQQQETKGNQEVLSLEALQSFLDEQKKAQKAVLERKAIYDQKMIDLATSKQGLSALEADISSSQKAAAEIQMLHDSLVEKEELLYSEEEACLKCQKELMVQRKAVGSHPSADQKQQIAAQERALNDLKESTQKSQKEIDTYKRRLEQVRAIADALPRKQEAFRTLQVEILSKENELQEECWQLDLLFERILAALSERGEWSDRKRLEIAHKRAQIQQLEADLLRDQGIVAGIEALGLRVDEIELQQISVHELIYTLQKELRGPNGLRKKSETQPADQSLAAELTKQEQALKAAKERGQSLDTEYEAKRASLAQMKQLQTGLMARQERIVALKAEINQAEDLLKTESLKPGLLEQKGKKLEEALAVREKPIIEEKKRRLLLLGPAAQTFVEHVVWGREEEAQAMLKENAELALVPCDVKDPAGRTFKQITGFQYAVWALDWKMWEMIKAYLPLDAAREQAKGFTEGAWVKEHAEHADWKGLLDALQTYINNYNSWNNAQQGQHWVGTVGGEQRKLPIHVLQEYCNPGRPFDPTPKFDEAYTLNRKLENWLLEPLKAAKTFDFGAAGGALVCTR